MTDRREHGQCRAVGQPTSAENPRSAEPRRLPGELEAVYREHADFVHRVACQLGVGHEHVEDVVHDVFLVVHRRLVDFDGRSMRSWLYGITRRVVLHLRRGTLRARRRALEHAPVPRSVVDPERRVELDRAVALVEAFVATLDDDQRVVFVLAELEGTPVPEIAAALGLNLNTVYSRLRLARRRFERAIAAAQPQEDRDG